MPWNFCWWSCTPELCTAPSWFSCSSFDVKPTVAAITYILYPSIQQPLRQQSGIVYQVCGFFCSKYLHINRPPSFAALDVWTFLGYPGKTSVHDLGLASKHTISFFLLTLTLLALHKAIRVCQIYHKTLINFETMECTDIFDFTTTTKEDMGTRGL